MANLSNYINGEWLAGSGAELATIDPSTGRQTWTSNASSLEDIARAAQAAHDSFEAWALTPLA
ncbi:MAG: N-succinylglutamate 5-semialdehyde dehydrogenase, partial [Oxalobacteraceae bacterium]